MSAVPAIDARMPFRGECYRCKEWGALHAITSLCDACHEADLAEYRARMADEREGLIGYEQSRLDHVETCRWCADSADAYGLIPPMYRCPRFARAVLAMAAVGTKEEETA